MVCDTLRIVGYHGVSFFTIVDGKLFATSISNAPFEHTASTALLPPIYSWRPIASRSIAVFFNIKLGP